MSRIARGFPPTQRIAHAISRGLYQRDLYKNANLHHAVDYTL